MIEVKGVSKTYFLDKTKVEALRGLNLEIKKGNLVCLMGPSGSGKSTLLNLIGCLDKPDTGSILIDGEDVTKCNRSRSAEIRAQKIGFVFQSFNLIPVLNVFENIEFPTFITKSETNQLQKKEWINHLINEIGLTEFIKHRPDELSGGQRQRVAIARALVTRPQIVLADEPTANLDSKTGELILTLIRELNKKEETTFLFATHDPKITRYASHVFELQDGAIKQNADSISYYKVTDPH